MLRSNRYIAECFIPPFFFLLINMWRNENQDYFHNVVRVHILAPVIEELTTQL